MWHSQNGSAGVGDVVSDHFDGFGRCRTVDAEPTAIDSVSMALVNSVDRNLLGYSRFLLLLCIELSGSIDSRNFFNTKK